MVSQPNSARHSRAVRRRRLTPAAAGAVLSASLALLCAVPTSASANEPCVGSSPNATDCVKLPIERDTIIMSAHDANNDGSWGYGWIKVAQGTNRALLGVDLSPVKDFTITGARLILWVAKNNFRSFNNDGTWFTVHAFEPLELDRQWKEGDDRWDQFNICSQTEWVRPAVHVPDYPGATWLCANDPSTSDNFDTTCASLQASWDPGGQYLDKVQTGFRTTYAGETIEVSDKTLCDFPATNPKGLNPPVTDCDPTCSVSIECFKDQVAIDPATADPSTCFRRVVIELDLDGEIARLNANRVQAATSCTSGFGLDACPELHPSWLLKRGSESTSNGGGFHYFSREGAVCILGDKNPSFSGGYAKLVPRLEVDVVVPQGQQAPADPEPVAHCDQYCEGPRPASGDCRFTAYNPRDGFPDGSCDEEYFDPSDPEYDPSECRLPCKQGSCEETVDPLTQDARCDCQ